MEAFSDGVFAIAVTLLVLNIHVRPGSGPLWEEILRLWPAYAAYVASFLTIGIMWLNHHALFSRVAAVDRPLVLLNLLLLMVVAFVPFPTEVLGDHILAGPDAQTASLLYAGVAVLIAITFSAVYTYIAAHPGLLASGFASEDFFRVMPWYSAGLASYLVCIPLSFVSPIGVVLIVALTASYYAFDRLPGRRTDGSAG